MALPYFAFQPHQIGTLVSDFHGHKLGRTHKTYNCTGFVREIHLSQQLNSRQACMKRICVLKTNYTHSPYIHIFRYEVLEVK